VEKLASFYTRLDGSIYNQHVPRYDTGAPFLTTAPWLYVYSFEPAALDGEKILTAVPAKIPLPDVNGSTMPQYSGQALVKSGELRLSVENEAGESLWGAKVTSGDTVTNLPAAPFLNFPGGHQYFFTLSTFGPSASASIRGFQMRNPARMERLPAQRRFGALMW
jgi:hypothetical protein